MRVALLCPVVIAMMIAGTGCEDDTKVSAAEQDPPTAFSLSPIDGAWELVWSSDADHTDDKGKISQFKMFKDGFFSLIMQDSLGEWSVAGAGTFSVRGKTYEENFRYATVPEYVGTTDWQEYELKGDTLYFKGFTRVLFANGEDNTSSFPAFLEKRVRARR